MWEWQGDEFALQEDVPKSLWNNVSQNEDLSYMFDEITPIKSCGDVGYHTTNSENTKNVKTCKPSSSQVKRRRMLQFDSEVLEIPYYNEEMPPSFLKPKVRFCHECCTTSLQGNNPRSTPVTLEEKEQRRNAEVILQLNDREDTIEETFSNMSQLVFGEDTSSSGYEGLDQSSEGWLADCLNDAETHSNSDDVDQSGASYVQNAGFCDTPPEHEASTVQKRRTRTRKNVVFKGKKSYMQSPTKVASSIVYPFAFIKPCGVHGDVTLRDINQRICTPPKPKQSKEDPSAAYPTSAFSGKPVVGKTKIHTEGGKGCITIMRTKG